jgi:hypothetical protein
MIIPLEVIVTYIAVRCPTLRDMVCLLGSCKVLHDQSDRVMATCRGIRARHCVLAARQRRPGLLRLMLRVGKLGHVLNRVIITASRHCVHCLRVICMHSRGLYSRETMEAAIVEAVLVKRFDCVIFLASSRGGVRSEEGGTLPTLNITDHPDEVLLNLLRLGIIEASETVFRKAIDNRLSETIKWLLDIQDWSRRFLFGQLRHRSKWKKIDEWLMRRWFVDNYSL